MKLTPFFKIISNLSIRGVFVLLSKLISFITIPIITQALGPINYGKYSYVLAIATYATLPANWGFLAKGIREVAEFSSESEHSQIVSKIFSTRLNLALIGSFLIILYFLFVANYQFKILLILALLHHIIMVTFIDYYYYGIKNVLVPTIAHFFSQLIYLFLVLLFINSSNDTLLLLSFMVIIVIIESISLLFFASRLKIKFQFSLKNAIKEFSQNFNLGTGLKIGLIQSSYPIIIIPFFFTNEILGNYSAAYKFYLLSSTVMQMVVLVVAPYIVKSKKYDIEKRKKYIYTYLGFSLLLGLLFGILLFSFSEQIVNLMFGEKFKQTTSYLEAFSYSVLLISPFYISLSSIMSNYSLDKKFMLGGLFQGVIILIFTPIVLALFDIYTLILLIGISMLISSIYYAIVLRSNKII